MAGWQVVGVRCDVVTTLADSYVSIAARGSGQVAEQAASRKCSKYAALPVNYSLLPLAFETHGPMNDAAVMFFNELGRRLSQNTGDSRETTFLYQRLSVTLQRFNAALFRNSFVVRDEADL